VVIFSFEALLSTALSGSYTQGLIHRKALIERIAGTENPLKRKKCARHWIKIYIREGTDRLEWPVCE
jgi:hypothetical protein